MELKQKRFMDNRHFKLLDKGVWIKIKNAAENIETTFRYDDLGIETTKVTQTDNASIIIWAVFGAFFFFGAKILIYPPQPHNVTSLVVLGVWFALLVLMFKIVWSQTYKEVIVIRGERATFSILSKTPNKKAVDEFIAALHDRVMDRAIQQTGIRNEDAKYLSSDRKRILDYLLDQGLITESKHRQVLEEPYIIQTEKPSIGFRAGGNGIPDNIEN